MKKILVTGATGQFGTALTQALRERYGTGKVIAAGHKRNPAPCLLKSGPYLTLDVRERNRLMKIVREFGIDTIYHLAALLSVRAEEDPERAWDVNVNGLRNVLEVARHRSCAVFQPGSIGASGPAAPRDKIPQLTNRRPATMYGVTKVTGELLCNYYSHRYRVNARVVRFPGLISHETMPGGGITDYAVEMFLAALAEKEYTCFLAPDTLLDMMYMPDAVRAAIAVMEARPEALGDRNAFNVSAMAFTPEELAAAIREHVPGFKVSYEVDPVRQAIADSWPNRVDDGAAPGQWDWQPEYDLETTTREMLEKLIV
ncbi:MAG: NAD-dependent epimerase/dehydratase family protein [Desulfobacterales bacterium]|nr:NAD-dependent epimerase/dehydratase family protein [Desulfobacterales bacterium]